MKINPSAISSYYNQSINGKKDSKVQVKSKENMDSINITKKILPSSLKDKVKSISNEMNSEQVNLAEIAQRIKSGNYQINHDKIANAMMGISEEEND